MLSQECRRVALDTFDRLRSLVRELFGISGPFTVTYEDDEGETITLSSDQELIEVYLIEYPQSVDRFACSKIQ
jgi:hypothetical protein